MSSKEVPRDLNVERVSMRQGAQYIYKGAYCARYKSLITAAEQITTEVIVALVLKTVRFLRARRERTATLCIDINGPQLYCRPFAMLDRQCTLKLAIQRGAIFDLIFFIHPSKKISITPATSLFMAILGYTVTGVQKPVGMQNASPRVKAEKTNEIPFVRLRDGIVRQMIYYQNKHFEGRKCEMGSFSTRKEVFKGIISGPWCQFNPLVISKKIHTKLQLFNL